MKNFLPEEAPKEFIRIIRFSEGVIGIAKIASSLEKQNGRIFLTEFGEHLFEGFFSQAKEKIHREKTPQKLSQ